MQTNFSLVQLADPNTREAEKILRACVHCGFCTATCPTYVLLGDELDSPRGRIYQIKDMLENNKPAGEKLVKHVDRCLSCLSCMTTCPSGVHYMHLVDHARGYIEQTYTRRWGDRALRRLLALLLPRPGLFRLALLAAVASRPLTRRLDGLLPIRLRAMLALAPRSLPAPSAVDRPHVQPARGPHRQRVALLTGCAQQVLAPEINEATERLLTRLGVEVVVASGVGCCGALTHHMGREGAAQASAKANVDAWMREVEGAGLDAIVINASGCGTTVKDYGYMLREDPVYSAKAAKISALTRDVSEFLVTLDGLAARRATGQKIAYHSACSLQHGQQIKQPPKHLLQAMGFEVVEPLEGHLCCGSAGTYNILQPEIATRLRDRKVDNLERLAPDAVAAGNIGCLTQIATGTDLPLVHSVGLIDWAMGGPLPKQLEGLARFDDRRGG
jgi:glycolate oxidase iron-sulfur subunit|tara:strand:+ start:8222 stop:9553 length:1332 start_codon:yes stop_codon:yes gene_type:complete